LLNGLLLWYALDRLLPERQATVALALLYLEVLLALQYGQSNALVAALMILAFVAFEGRRQLGAASSITGGAAVKLFPLAALSLAIFYPGRLRFAAIFGAVLAVAVLLPLVAVSPAQLLAQYDSWRAIEAKDALLRGYSLMHYMHAWLGVDWPNWPQQAAGTALLLLPLALRSDRWPASSSGGCSCARCSSTRCCSTTRPSPRRSLWPTRGSSSGTRALRRAGCGRRSWPSRWS